MTKQLFQLNLQQHFGGGEVYTHFLCQGLDALNIGYTLLTHPKADYWHKLSFGNTKIQPITPDLDGVITALGDVPAVLLTHGGIDKKWRKQLKGKGHRLIAIAHMPLYGRDPSSYDGYDGVIGVSRYVIESLKDAKVENIYPEPWYGVASLSRHIEEDAPILQASCYDWDLRKGRDRILSWLEPVYEQFRPKVQWQKQDGLSIGIVSRITPIKQFPLMFEHIAQALSEVPNLNIEIFGSGGYASVRDLRKALGPLGDRVRFWGFQKNVEGIYSQLDFLIAGLPEKEALGLNVIEAQHCNLPVLAVKASPFVETVVDGKTGFLFEDPRNDNGADLKAILTDIQNGLRPMPQPQQHKAHLDEFSLPVFTQRVEKAVSWLLS
ncbi:glycosyltransferase family 4 protein [Photobacterium sanguinicancri]|uniref:Glycosyltransferase family 4 protein n=1 Tax=Photobacterium sanguinicancri TaxID=875932 RepID=A0AAW7Y3K3_9GAMM|nr:glycosyltransferase family 4 protein [Photobacterium sanguinicancri]MDO6543156.1 glycosyltransferase family 4 protein [Photobacterium sanguinicancri]